MSFDDKRSFARSKFKLGPYFKYEEPKLELEISRSICRRSIKLDTFGLGAITLESITLLSGKLISEQLSLILTDVRSLIVVQLTD